MSPNEISSSFDKILIFSSSESSDSESLLQEDIKSGGNHINKQWEAIERTLYQEPGQQVTDPELLKECKLWRETFPHLRVKGTKVDLNQSNNEVEETEKSIQTLKNHFDLKKLEQKRETIKKKVVGELVERLIAKYGFDKEETLDVRKNNNSGVQITEIIDSDSEKVANPSPKNNNNNGVVKNSAPTSVISNDKESYFERGKKEYLREGEGMTEEQMEKNLYDIFDSWEKECKTPKLPKSCDPRKAGNPNRQNPTQKNSHTPKMWYKPKKFIPASDSLSNLEKPYEVTKKIDKKYEGLIERIMEKKINEFDSIRHCRSSASKFEVKSYQESLEKLRKESGFDDYLKRRGMPKLNNFNNNWLRRSEINSHTENNIMLKSAQNAKPKTKKSINLSSERSQDKMEEKFLEDLRAELTLVCKKPAKKNGIIEEFRLHRPKSFAPLIEKSFKSSSCGEFPNKNKKDIKNRQLQKGLDLGKSESNFKNRIKSNKLNNNKGNKSNVNQNSLLPPIESGIICKEIKKMGTKNIISRRS